MIKSASYTKFASFRRIEVGTWFFWMKEFTNQQENQQNLQGFTMLSSVRLSEEKLGASSPGSSSNIEMVSLIFAITSVINF